MEPLASLTKRRNLSGKLTKNSKLFKSVIAAIQEKKGENIVSLDLRKIPEAVADFFIVCEATSQPQVKAIADNIEERVKENCGENVFHKEGFQSMQWVLVDFVNVVIHIMQPETRKFYNLEEMWSDAVVEEHQ
ncbi:ribosome silencing factor [Niabella yanshanensis]|uniref:Ribosomal silencing factor RsfS n=1 Tax=Niabella yanshanensis TaxID=577386 RepID=A0ABZ0WDC8_9BACT|nr:ribosome silencing factor [Niabella yanshanensis]WQD40713.1 ribosome silencing factor [Niabella yanshanensis]